MKSVRAKPVAATARQRPPPAPKSVRVLARQDAADGKARGAAKAGAPPPAGLLAEDLEEGAAAVSRLAERAAPPESKAAARPPRVAAIRARYRAVAILEAGSDRGSLVKALSLLEEARSLAPGLVGIGDEIARVRMLLRNDNAKDE